jgi:multidrug efflux pump subunit AcrB
VAALPPTGTGATQALPPQPPAYVPPPPAYAPPPPQPSPSYPPPPPRRRSSRTPLIVLAVLLLLAGAGAGIAAATGAFSGGDTNTVTTQVTTDPTTPTTPTQETTPTTPTTDTAVSEAAVRDLLVSYETAFSAEDPGALDSLFTSDFRRRAPPKPDMSRDEAIAEYKRQFAQLDNPSYRLSGVSIQTGPNGAVAEGSYRITDSSGGPPATGTITFGIIPTDDGLRIESLDIRSDP